MTRLFTLLCFIVLSAGLSAQELQPYMFQYDSILTHTSGTDQFAQLNELAFRLIYLNPVASSRIATEAFELAKSDNDKPSMARSLSITGSSYWARNSHQIAMDYYLKARDLYSELNDNEGIADIYNNIGELYKRTGEYEKALASHHQSIALRLKFFPDKKVYSAFANIAEVFMEMNNNDSASFYLQKAAELVENTDDYRAKAYVKNDFGLMYLRSENHEKADNAFQEALEYWELDNNTRGELITSLNQIELLIERKQFEKADSLLKIYTVVADEILANNLLIKAYYLRVQIDSAQDNWESAFESNVWYEHFKDSVNDNSHRNLLQLMETEYERDVRIKENEILKTQSRLQTLIVSAIAVLLIFTLIMAYSFYRRSVVKSRLHHEAKLKNETIEQQKEEIQVKADQLKLLNENLEVMVNQRTQKLKEKNKQLEHYAFINSHSVRGPVVSIMGNLNLLKRERLSEEGMKKIDQLWENAVKLDEITKEINLEIKSRNEN